MHETPPPFLSRKWLNFRTYLITYYCLNKPAIRQRIFLENLKVAKFGCFQIYVLMRSTFNTNKNLPKVNRYDDTTLIHLYICIYIFDIIVRCKISNQRSFEIPETNQKQPSW